MVQLKGAGMVIRLNVSLSHSLSVFRSMLKVHQTRSSPRSSRPWSPVPSSENLPTVKHDSCQTFELSEDSVSHIFFSLSLLCCFTLKETQTIDSVYEMEPGAAGRSEAVRTVYRR